MLTFGKKIIPAVKTVKTAVHEASGFIKIPLMIKPAKEQLAAKRA